MNFVKNLFTKKLLALIVAVLAIVLILLLVGVIKVQAQEVWIVASPQPDIEEVKIIFNGVDEGWNPYQEIITSDGSCNPCAAIRRVDTEADGNHATTVQYRNVWGESQIVPFGFTKSTPPDPSGIGLKRK